VTHLCELLNFSNDVHSFANVNQKFLAWRK